MSKNNKHLQHVRSSEYKEGSDNKLPKLPIASDLVYGEFALNFAKGVETISIKNSADEIVTFPNNVDIANITSAITKISGDSITSITSNDKSITISSGTNSVDLSVPEHLISDDYESVVYPSDEEGTYPKGATPVAAKDDLDTVAKKLDTSISALTQEVLDAEETISTTLHKHNESNGFDENGNYTGATDTMNYIGESENLTDAVQILDGVVYDLSQTPARVSDAYEAVEYPEEEGTTYPEGVTPVVAKDDLDTVAKKLDTSISALTREVINDEYVTRQAIEQENKSSGFDRNGKYTGATENMRYIDESENLTDAVQILDGVVYDLSQTPPRISSAYTSVVYPSVNGTTYPEGATPVAANDNLDTVAKKLDTSISALTQAVLENEIVTSQALRNHNDASGLDENGKYTGATASMNYIGESTDLTNAVQILDGAIGNTNGDIINIQTDIVSLSGKTITSITSNDNSVTISTSTNSVDLSVDLPSYEAIISADYESVVYPELEGVTYPEGVTPVAANDNLDTVAKKLDTSISALTQEVLDNEVTTSKALMKHNNSSGFDINGKYTGATDAMNYIDDSENLTDAVQILDGAIKSVDTNISTLSSKTLTSITSNDNSITISTSTNSVDLSAQKPIISVDYESVVYPEVSGTTYPEGVTPVAANDDLDTVATKLDTSVSALTQEVLDNEIVTAQIFKNIAESSGFDENIKYTGATDTMKYINESENLTDAVQILDGAINNVSGDIINIQAEISTLSSKTLTSITSNDNSITISSGTNSVDLSAQKPIISDDYESVVYPELEGVTYPEGVTPVAANDDLDTVAKKLDTSVSALTQEVLENEVTTSKALHELNNSSGFDENGKYTGDTEDMKYISESDNLTDAVQILDEVIDDTNRNVTRLTTKVNGLTDNFTNYVAKSGDTMSGGLEITSGGLAVSGDTTINGTITATGSIYSSDIKLKENISEINTDDTQKISQVQLKEYNFISDTAKIKKYGVIAQELEESGLNNLVYETQDGTKGVDYISFLILKIQQLEQEIKDLKKQ